jgi:GT2 family glycosyltransferase
MARGDLLGYLSADDVLRPGALEAGAAALSRNAHAVLAYPDFGLIDENSRSTGVVRTQDYSEEALFRELICLPGPGALFRREAFQRAGGWNERLRQVPDLDFFLRLALQGPFIRVPEVLADFRIHSGSATYRRASPERADEPVCMLKEFFGRNDVPVRLRHWQSKTTANGYLLSAMIHGQSRRLKTAAARFAQALRANPQTVMSKKAAGYAMKIAQITLKNRIVPNP